jgi:hypothetical protein
VADRREADELLVVALASGQTVTAAAASAGVGVKTVRRRLKEDGFRLPVRHARSEMVAAVAGRLAGNMTLATDTLVTLLTDPDSGVKLRAATKIVELGLRAAEVVDLEQRVQELERANAPDGGDDGDD